MVDQRDDVVNFIKANGPVLPVQVAKHVNTNILFASAMLAELVERKMLKITHFSVGGSPLYYLSGQEEPMDRRLGASLGGKEKEAYNLIKEKKVIREIDLEPWQRVAIKSLKDFTSQLNVGSNENNEVFWKYHLVNEEEAKSYVQNIMDQIYGKQEVINNQSSLQENIVDIEKQKIDTLYSGVIVKELAEKLREELLKEMKLEKEIKPKEIKIKPEAKKEEKKKADIKPDGKFYNNIISYFADNNINVLSEELVKKDKEFDFIIELPSALGNLRYFVKAKSKPNINDADVSMAFSDGQDKKLPIILLSNGKTSKKANELIEKKLKGQIILKLL